MFASQVLAERLEVTAERAQQMLRVPGQDPGVEQRIAEVGRQVARETARERPGQDDGRAGHTRRPRPMCLRQAAEKAGLIAERLMADGESGVF